MIKIKKITKMNGSFGINLNLLMEEESQKVFLKMQNFYRKNLPLPVCVCRTQKHSYAHLTDH